MMFFGNFDDFMDAIQNNEIGEYIDNLAKEFNPRNRIKKSINVQDKISHIMEYLSWKGEDVYTLRFDIQPSVYIVFPNGIKSKRIYDKLFNSNLIDKKQDESIVIMMYPRYEKLYDIISSILLSY